MNYLLTQRIAAQLPGAYNHMQDVDRFQRMLSMFFVYLEHRCSVPSDSLIEMVPAIVSKLGFPPKLSKPALDGSDDQAIIDAVELILRAIDCLEFMQEPPGRSPYEMTPGLRLAENIPNLIQGLDWAGVELVA